MRVFFVRHGETEFNKARKYLGITDVPLNYNGMKQMKEIASQLKLLKINLIITSGLYRTIQSARIIIEENGLEDIEIVTDKYYNERNFGAWENLNANDIERLYPDDWKSFIDAPFYTTPMDGEAYESFRFRVITEFSNLIQSVKPSDNILFVGHAGVIREIISNFFDKDIDYWDIRIESGHIYTYVLD